MACIPFAYVFSLPCWGRPSGCIIPKPLGPDPVACIFLYLPKLIFLPCLTCLRLSPAQSSRPTGPPHRHDAGAWVRPCHVDKSERSISGSRQAPRTSPHQALSAFISSRSNRRRTGNHNGKLCFSLCWLAGKSRGEHQEAPRAPTSFMQSACTLKGGHLSITTHGLLLALQPSPPGLVHGMATWHTSDG